ncbi:hypothetical protein EC973_005980 [Apophysomyces ossiformis]|uniref:Uncharacterized protein n=1 Tax=Apophysomyces ossiformis TaxID=679940 RepID=A0A8H7BJY0_9FUNG|nr:hypothetical protein EC973_005980 [Apophysomyces ossiformis]
MAAKIAQSKTSAFSTLPPAPKRSYNYAPPPPPDIPEPDLSHLQGREEWAPRSAIALPGEWQIVKPTPSPSSESPKTEKKEARSTTHDQKPEFQDDAEEEDEEDLRNFKIREKEYPDDALEVEAREKEADDATEAGEGLFKKRKAPSQSNIKAKKRNIRKK